MHDIILYSYTKTKSSLIVYIKHFKQVGFNAGDNVNYYVIEKSGTPDIVDIETTSNINQTGVWIFRVDQAEITEAPTEDPGMYRAY